MARSRDSAKFGCVLSGQETLVDIAKSLCDVKTTEARM